MHFLFIVFMFDINVFGNSSPFSFIGCVSISIRFLLSDTWAASSEIVQNAQIQIILRMRKVSSGPLLSIHTFLHAVSNRILLADSEGSDHCANAQANLGIRLPHMPEDTYCMARPTLCTFSSQCYS